MVCLATPASYIAVLAAVVAALVLHVVIAAAVVLIVNGLPSEYLFCCIGQSVKSSGSH